jgi:3-methyladenine DNA glycosylase AlkD
LQGSGRRIEQNQGPKEEATELDRDLGFGTGNEKPKVTSRRSITAMAITLKETLAQLESLSDAKVRAHNTKNGAGKNQFGVKHGDIRKIAAKIKTNDALAEALWNTGNIDAQLLAILLITPKKLSRKEMDRMVRSAKFVHVADWLNSYVVKNHPDKESLRQSWMDDDDPWAARAGWSLTSGRVARKSGWTRSARTFG